MHIIIYNITEDAAYKTHGYKAQLLILDSKSPRTIVRTYPNKLKRFVYKIYYFGYKAQIS